MNRATKPKLLVCADDLTGANDIGVQFAKRGISATVLIEPERETLPREYEVVVVNTESRHARPDAAADRIRSSVARAREAGVRWFYKKTDSTLRGNVGAELQAFREATGVKLLPFAPALPELGRTTREGIHYVQGQPLHETEFGRDPLNPITTSSVARILQEQCSLPVHSVSAPDRITTAHEGIVVLDAASTADMERIARELASRGLLTVCAGPAGFGAELARWLKFDGGEAFDARCSGPVLVVNGSLNERSLAQIRQAGPDLDRFRLGADFLLREEAPLPPVPKGRGDLLVYSVADRAELKSVLEAAPGLSQGEAHQRAARNTGAFVKHLLAQRAFGTVVVFGGDTLMEIARANGWKAFIPWREVMDGVTVCSPENGGLVVISKAGGFGDPDALERILEDARGKSAFAP